MFEYNSHARTQTQVKFNVVRSLGQKRLLYLWWHIKKIHSETHRSAICKFTIFFHQSEHFIWHFVKANKNRIKSESKHKLCMFASPSLDQSFEKICWKKMPVFNT